MGAIPITSTKSILTNRVIGSKHENGNILLMGVPRFDTTVSITMESRQSSRKNYKLNANDNKYALAA